MVIDAHQHFWALARGGYSFPSPDDPVLYRDFSPLDIIEEMEALEIGGCIAVQAAEAIDETEFLVQLAHAHTFIRGVVGWCDLGRPDGLADLNGCLATGALVGIRPMLQRYENVEWLNETVAAQNIAKIIELDLSFDALVDVRHLASIDRLAREYPDLRIVIDHMAKPWRYAERLDQWTVGMKTLASHANCWVKISGYPFVPEGGRSPLALYELIDRLGDWFGMGRLIWGSDWPVLTRHVHYGQAFHNVRDLIAREDRQRVFSSNVVDAYALK